MEINDIKPSSIRHIIGQEQVIQQVTVALDAAQQEGKKFAHALMVGPPGVGKSALAQVVANEMAEDFHETLGQSITTPGDLNALLLAANERDVVHIDEAHELKKPFQTALYLALDKQRVFLPGSGKGRTITSLPLADFTLLLSTTDEYCLLQPLRDRMKLLLRFDFYSQGELAAVLHGRVRALSWEVEEEVLPLIAQRSRGVPRLALRLLEATHRVRTAEGAAAITIDHLERACELEGLDGLGLGPTEQRYLEIVGGGAGRLNLIASMLGLPTRTVSTVIEPFLLRAGLLLKGDQGHRELTALGRDHWAKNRKDCV